MYIGATIAKVLKLPSLKGSYLAAGFNGLNRKVKRIDILDLPYPEVNQYLEPGELMLTSFWNSRTNPEARLGLAQAIFKSGGAGLGIMPSICLGEIDPEIIEFGNKFRFPIICLPPTTRWSDIITDFGRHFCNVESNKAVSGRTPNTNDILRELMGIRSRFLTDYDLTGFLQRLASLFGVTMAIKCGDQFFFAGNNRLLRLARDFLMNSNLKTSGNDEAIYHLGNDYLGLVLHSTEYTLLSIVRDHDTEILSLIISIRPLITEPIDPMLSRIVTSHKKSFVVNSINQNDQFHISALHLDSSITSFLEYCNRSGIQVFNLISSSDIIVFGIPGGNDDNVYRTYNDLINRFSPSLLVISSRSYYGEHLGAQLAIVAQLLGQLPYLNGIFELEELPLLYAMTFIPFHIKEMYYQLFQNYIDTTRLDATTATTFRLYLILKSTRKVGILQGIHANTVKYRIQKVLHEDKLTDDNNILSSLPLLPCLLGLEMLCVEDELLMKKPSSKPASDQLSYNHNNIEEDFAH